MFENLEITWATILGIFGAVAVVGNGLSILKKWLKPAHNIKNQVIKQAELQETQMNQIKVIQETEKIILASLSTLLEFETTGISEEKLIEANENLRNFLIDR
jgi:hypothetical protein